MPKFYKKSELSFVDGYVIDSDNNVVCLPDNVAEQINKLETWIQKSDYLAAQPKEQAAPSLDGFERKSSFSKVRVVADTPEFDARMETAARIRAELANKESCDVVNELIEKMFAMFDWVNGDTFVEGTAVVRIDTPVLGNPLEFRTTDLVRRITDINATDYGIVVE